jgi:hypothetical protein
MKRCTADFADAHAPAAGGNTLTFYVCRQRQSLLRGDVLAEAAKQGVEAR